jgi:hypothetical protein
MRLDSIRAAFYQAAHVVAFLYSAGGFCAAMPSYWLENPTQRE